MFFISRNIYEKGFFHVMVQGLNKEYIFDKNYFKDTYIRLVKKYIKEYDVLVLAYCIMDNHAHMLVYTEKISELSNFMQNINSKFALYYNKEKVRVGYVFRGRFNSQYIDSKQYLLRCLNYIHRNPVNANMVKQPGDYKYSTYNDFINKTGIVNDTVIEKIFGEKNNYLNIFLNISNKDMEIMDIDREDKNFEIATKIFLAKNEIEINKIKKDKQILHKFCIELIKNKKYKSHQVAKLLDISEATISRAMRDERN